MFPFLFLNYTTIEILSSGAKKSTNILLLPTELLALEQNNSTATFNSLARYPLEIPETINGHLTAVISSVHLKGLSPWWAHLKLKN